MNLKLAMVTIDSSDPRPLARWWADRLGVEILEENEGWYFRLGGTPSLAIQHVPDPTPGKNRIHLDLTAADLDFARDALIESGASLVEERGTDTFRWITLADPQGNQFCIAQDHDATA